MLISFASKHYRIGIDDYVKKLQKFSVLHLSGRSSLFCWSGWSESLWRRVLNPIAWLSHSALSESQIKPFMYGVGMCGRCRENAVQAFLFIIVTVELYWKMDFSVVVNVSLLLIAGCRKPQLKTLTWRSSSLAMRVESTVSCGASQASWNTPGFVRLIKQQYRKKKWAIKKIERKVEQFIVQPPLTGTLSCAEPRFPVS